ncbi:unnamed protein product, partial [Durusdinium trenchii]
ASQRHEELTREMRELRTRRVNAVGSLHGKLCALHGKPWVLKAPPSGARAHCSKTLSSHSSPRSPQSPQRSMSCGSRSQSPQPSRSMSRKRKALPRRLKKLKEASSSSLEAAEERRKQRMAADGWIFETCPRYTVPGGVIVKPPVWKDLPKGMSAFHRSLIDVVGQSLRKKDKYMSADSEGRDSSLAATSRSGMCKSSSRNSCSSAKRSW